MAHWHMAHAFCGTLHSFWSCAGSPTSTLASRHRQKRYKTYVAVAFMAAVHRDNDDDVPDVSTISK